MIRNICFLIITDEIQSKLNEIDFLKMYHLCWRTRVAMGMIYHLLYSIPSLNLTDSHFYLFLLLKKCGVRFRLTNMALLPSPQSAYWNSDSELFLLFWNNEDRGKQISLTAKEPSWKLKVLCFCNNNKNYGQFEVSGLSLNCGNVSGKTVPIETFS